MHTELSQCLPSNSVMPPLRAEPLFFPPNALSSDAGVAVTARSQHSGSPVTERLQLLAPVPCVPESPLGDA